MEIAVAFGNVIRRLRLERGLSQEEVSYTAELQRKYISLLERAEYQPKLVTIFRLAEALGCRPAQLIELVEDELKQSGRKRPSK